MIKRAIITTAVSISLTVFAAAIGYTINAGPLIVKSIQGAYMAHAKANRR